MMPRVLVVDDDTLYAEAATAILGLTKELGSGALVEAAGLSAGLEAAQR